MNTDQQLKNSPKVDRNQIVARIFVERETNFKNKCQTFALWEGQSPDDKVRSMLQQTSISFAKY